MRRLFLRMGALACMLTAAASARADTPRDADEKAQQARALFDEGIRHYVAHDIDAALLSFEQSERTRPSRGARQNIAACLKVLRRYDAAATALESALRDFSTMRDADRAEIETLLAEVRAHTGTLRVDALQGATVTVDGVDRARAPASPLRLDAGSHMVRVTREGFQPFEQKVDVPAGVDTALKADLGPLVKSGRLRVSEGRALEMPLFIDNAEVGKTPWEGTLTVGPHALQLRSSDGVGSAVSGVDVRDQNFAAVTLVAEPLRCRIRIEPAPANTVVNLNDTRLGPGAWSGPVRCGAYRIDAAAEGFMPLARTLIVEEGREATVRLELDVDARQRRQARLVVRANAGVLAVPSTGGAPSAGCNEGCTSPIGVGGHVTSEVGVRLPAGFGVGLSTGYLAFGKRYQGGRAMATPTGRSPSLGTGDDSLVVRGPRVGAVAFVESAKSSWNYGARLSAGALFASWRMTRDATLTTSDTATTYAAHGLEDGDSLVTPFVMPEAVVGYKLNSTWTAEMSVSGLFLFGLDRASWQSRDATRAGACATDAERLDKTTCQGLLQFAPQTAFSSTVGAVGVNLGVSARFE